MASGNLASKLSRAIAYYLARQGVLPLEQIYWQGTNREWTLEHGPTVHVRVGRGEPWPECTGNRNYTVYVSVKGSALSHPDETGSENARAEFDAVVGRVLDALMVSDDGGQTLRATADAITQAGRSMAETADDSAEAAAFSTAHADMGDFTLLHWQDDGDGEVDAEDADWELLLQFRAVACSSTIS